jgi:predicted DNA-binding transcriptional regulator AlpA
MASRPSTKQATPENRPVSRAPTLTPIFVDRETAAQALSLGVSTFMREVRAGRCPKPRLISPGRVGWLWSELVEHATSRPIADLLPPPSGDNRRGKLKSVQASSHD